MANKKLSEFSTILSSAIGSLTKLVALNGDPEENVNINVSDFVVNDLTTNNQYRALSAAQGKALNDSKVSNSDFASFQSSNDSAINAKLDISQANLTFQKIQKSVITYTNAPSTSGSYSVQSDDDIILSSGAPTFGNDINLPNANNTNIIGKEYTIIHIANGNSGTSVIPVAGQSIIDCFGNTYTSTSPLGLSAYGSNPHIFSATVISVGAGTWYLLSPSQNQYPSIV